MLGQQRLGFLHGLADNQSVISDAERPQLELMPSGTGTADLLLAPVLLLVKFAGGFKIDTKQCRPDQCDDDGRADRAEDIRDRVGDRHRIKEVLGFFRREAQAVDRVGGKTHRRRNRL